MKIIGELAIPMILLFVTTFAIVRGTDVFSGMTAGARDGLKTVIGIVPALVTMLPCVYMLRASGVLDALSELLAPALSFIGMPVETLPLMLTRPFSGSGALAIGSEIIKTSGADSFAGRCAAVMLGSTETTFYVIAVYFGAAGIRRSRHAVPAALIADLVGFMASVLCVRIFWG